MEALSDASSGLTYPALSGTRKQSVIDAERLPILLHLCETRDMSTKPNTSKPYGTGEGHLTSEDSVSYSDANSTISF